MGERFLAHNIYICVGGKKKKTNFSGTTKGSWLFCLERVNDTFEV